MISGSTQNSKKIIDMEDNDWEIVQTSTPESASLSSVRTEVKFSPSTTRIVASLQDPHPLKYASLADLSTEEDEIAALVNSLEATAAYKKVLNDLSEIDLLPMPRNRSKLNKEVETARNRVILASKNHENILKKVNDDKAHLAVILQAGSASSEEAKKILKPYLLEAAVTNEDKADDLGEPPSAPTSRRASDGRFT